MFEEGGRSRSSIPTGPAGEELRTEARQFANWRAMHGPGGVSSGGQPGEVTAAMVVIDTVAGVIPERPLSQAVAAGLAIRTS